MFKHLFIAFLFSFNLVFSQDLSCVQYTTHEGLPSNQVYNIFQDKNGFVWFATDRGIVSFDGNKFNKYDQKNGLPSSTVFRFYPQINGDVWCSTFSNKWFYFNPDNLIFKLYSFNDSVVKYSNGALNENLYISDDGTVNVGFQTHSGVLSISAKGDVIQSIDGYFNHEYRYDVIEYDDNYFFNYSLSSRPSESLFKTSFENYSIHQFNKKQLGYYHKSYRYGNRSYFSNHNELVIQKDSIILKKTFDKDIIGIGAFDSTHLWVGFTKGGLKIISLDGKEIKHYLKGKSVTFCFKDTHDGLWISTLTNGVYYVRNKYINKYFLKDNYISFVNNGKGNNVLVGTFFGNNYELDENFSRLVSSNRNEKPFYNFYNTIYQSYLKASSTIDKRFFQLQLNNNEYTLSRISTLCTDQEKPFLIAATHSFSYFNSNSSSPITKHVDKRIRTLCWKEHGIYIGTLNGLLVYDTLTNQFSDFKDDLLNVRVESIKCKNDITYMGTMGKGLLIQDSTSITQISSFDGLSSDLVNSVFVESDSIIWLGTNNGLNKVVRTEDSVVVEVYNEDDGLSDSYINDVFVKNNVVWIATKSGLCSMRKHFFKKDKHVNLFLKWSTISCQNVFLNDSLLGDLNFRQNNLIFSYDAAFFSANNGVSFRYKFDGKEEDWNYTSSRQIKYSLLSPGKYLLKIQASVNGSNWSENELSKHFVIHPPFYQSNWFYVMVVVLIVIVFYLFFKLRVLTYNRDIVRELLRYLLKKITPKTNSFIVKEQGIDIKINSSDVLFVKSDGNYLEIHTEVKRHVIRCKIGDFLNIADVSCFTNLYIVSFPKLLALRTERM